MVHIVNRKVPGECLQHALMMAQLQNIRDLKARRGGKEDAVVNRKIFHSNLIEANRISIVWPPCPLDRVMFLKVPIAHRANLL